MWQDGMENGHFVALYSGTVKNSYKKNEDPAFIAADHLGLKGDVLPENHFVFSLHVFHC